MRGMRLCFGSTTVWHAKFYKLNELHVPVIFYTVYGVSGVLKWLKNNKAAAALLIVAYLASFGCFLHDEVTYPVVYENYGQSALSRMLWNEYEDAIKAAKEKVPETGNISIINLPYANVLLCERYSPLDFKQQAVFEGDNMAFRSLRSFGQFYFDVWPSEQTEGWVFVIPYNVEADFEKAGYTVERVTNCYGIAYE